MNWNVIATAAISGGVFGAGASLVVPWSQWGVEKRRTRREHRRQLVDSWRAMINEHSNKPLDRVYLTDARYQTLRPLLQVEAKSAVERPDNEVTVIANAPRGIAGNANLIILDREVSRLEKAWGIAP